MEKTLPTVLLSFLLRPLLIIVVLLPCCRNILTFAAGGGKWDLLLSNIGISAMHMQLLNNDKVVIFDFGPSNISLPNGKCRNDSNDLALKIDCTAHSVEYNVADNVVRTLMVLTNTWCSSENNDVLTQRRWYATNHLLPDGRQIIIGGRGQFN
ncbi:Hypothetical predicted protein [Olea europaea subsp. europaea]|uniref:Glyoxal oxidase N-terminal domain-containing protein n=1 Tax=Olea europaea subsp. europaea TaxID=158383 RepID=A0A8S0VJL3_OLEEU|nr:Hypothetical predicted protein [Olea europaea subsp. europaea]